MVGPIVRGSVENDAILVVCYVVFRDFVVRGMIGIDAKRFATFDFKPIEEYLKTMKKLKNQAIISEILNLLFFLARAIFR